MDIEEPKTKVTSSPAFSEIMKTKETLKLLEMAAHGEQGICFNCDSWLIPSIAIKKLFIMEVDPFSDYEEDAKAEKGGSDGHVQ